jgi:hypothetical protein
VPLTVSTVTAPAMSRTLMLPEIDLTMTRVLGGAAML